MNTSLVPRLNGSDGDNDYDICNNNCDSEYDGSDGNSDYDDGSDDVMTMRMTWRRRTKMMVGKL